MGVCRSRARDDVPSRLKKTGRKLIYLSAAAAAILSTLPRIDGNPYVIPGVKTGQPRADLKRPWDAICEVAGLDGVRLHDLRHSFASVGAGASLGLPVIEKPLGHSQPSTTQRYALLTLIRCGARPKRSAQLSRRRWRANGNRGQLITCTPASNSVNLGPRPDPPVGQC
jgi:integrase